MNRIDRLTHPSIPCHVRGREHAKISGMQDNKSIIPEEDPVWSAIARREEIEDQLVGEIEIVLPDVGDLQFPEDMDPYMVATIKMACQRLTSDETTPLL